MKKILCVLALAAVTFSASGAVSKKSPETVNSFSASGDGKITFYRPDKNERGTYIYRNDKGEYIPSALADINHMFRCRLTGEVYPIDVRLIEELDAIEDHFEAGEVRLISQYRSPARNALMRQQGRGVAKMSLHMRGMAADIEISGVAPARIRDFAYSLKRGGVGYYGSNSFVHVDTGALRAWGWSPPQSARTASAVK